MGTTDFCKALQYCKQGFAETATSIGSCGYVFVSRVLLGHPYEATGPMQAHKRPPNVEGLNVPHDSTVARPGIPNGLPGGQIHWEFVVPGSQAYPELLVCFNS